MECSMAPHPDQMHTPQSQMDLELWILQITILGGSTKRSSCPEAQEEQGGDPEELRGAAKRRVWQIMGK